MSGISLASDCNNIGSPGKITIHRFDINTLHTPYNENLSGSTSAGAILTYRNSNNYGIQLALMSGEVEGKGTAYLRGCNLGEWQEWNTIVPHTKRQTGIATDYGLTIDVRKAGFTVSVRIYGRVSEGSVPISANTDYVIATLPEEFRPAYTMGWNCYITQGSAYAPFLIGVDLDGSVHLNVPANVENLGYINIAYVYGCEF